MRNRVRRILKTAKDAFWLFAVWPVAILLSAFAPDWGEVLGPYDD